MTIAIKTRASATPSPIPNVFANDPLTGSIYTHAVYTDNQKNSPIASGGGGLV